jgi:flagellar protein FlbD
MSRVVLVSQWSTRFVAACGGALLVPVLRGAHGPGEKSLLRPGTAAEPAEPAGSEATERDMFWATRISGQEIVINADLVEVIETTPDTVITLIDGKKYVVVEPAQEIIDRVVAYRAAIIGAPQAPSVARKGTVHRLSPAKTRGTGKSEI